MNLINRGIERYGINFGGSRLNNAVPAIYNRAEKYFAKKLYCEDALLTSSGTLAGVFLANYFNKNKVDLYICSDLHPALKCNFNSGIIFEELQELLHLLKQKKTKKLSIILLNTLNPVSLKTIDMEIFSEFRDIENLVFVFDDSHGIGIKGVNRWGISGIAKANNLKYIVLASLAKAFSLEGGIIAGEKYIVDNIRKQSLWGGASPPPPFYFYALIKAENIIESQVQKLQRNILYFKDKLKQENRYKYLPDFPVFVNTGNSLYEYLLDKGIKISAFCYPTKNDPLTERIVINANHSFEDLDYLLNFLD